MADPTPTSVPSDPILNLDTFVERAVVRIDGEPYALRNRGELSVLTDKRFKRESVRLGTLLGLERDPTPEEDKEVSRLIVSLCRIAIDAPDEVHNKLSEEQRLRIAEAFLQLRTRTVPASGARAMATVASPTGASSGRG